MNAHGSPLHRIAGLVAVAAVALVMAGCAKKVTSVDSAYTSPEGARSNLAQHIAYPDRPVTVFKYQDLEPVGPGAEDVLVETDVLYPAQGVIHGMIFDRTPASGFQLLRREANGAYAPLFDYVLAPNRRFLDTGAKLFTWQDGAPSSFSPPTYLGRGVLGGVITPQSPLTNPALVSRDSLLSISVTSDSLRDLSWSPITGAAGYLVHIYQFKGGKSDEILAASPAPAVTTLDRDALIEWVPADRPSAPLVFTAAPYIVPVAPYLVRVVAIDAEGRMIGFSYGEMDYAPGPEVGYYRLYRHGGVTVAAAAIRQAGSLVGIPIHIGTR